MSMSAGSGVPGETKLSSVGSLGEIESLLDPVEVQFFSLSQAKKIS